MQHEYRKCEHSMELTRRQRACTSREREPLIWMGNDDHVSIPRCLSVQLVGYVTAFPGVNGVKKLERPWCGLLLQNRGVKNRPQTSPHYSASVRLEARVWATCLYYAGEHGRSTDLQTSSRKHILVLQMLGLFFFPFVSMGEARRSTAICF